MKEIHCIITGRVQRVLFRDFVRRKASRLGLVGVVFNCADGSVTVIAQGEKETLENLLEHLKIGSLLARVDDMDVTWREPRKTFEEFKIVY